MQPIEFEEFVEEGANLEHDRWARWQKYFFSKCCISISSKTDNVNLTLPRVLFERWEKQIETKYSELSEIEKESDRKETRNYLPLIKNYFLPKRVVDKMIKEAKEEEHQFFLNILNGIDIADKQMGNAGGGTKAIRHALRSRII